MSQLGHYALIFVTAFVIALAMSPLAKKLAYAIGAVDKPKARGVSKVPLARLGGAAIYIAFTATVAIFLRRPDINLTGILIGSTIIMLVGVIDDVVTLRPRDKFLGQLAAAAVLPLFGVKVALFTNPFGGLVDLGVWGIPLTILWVVVIVNAMNFIDGMDGLAAGVASIASITLLAVAVRLGQVPVIMLTVVLAGSTLGFLPYNVNPAKMIMGDSGAMFLGYILAAISIQGTLKSAAALAVFIPLLALGLPIMDTSLVIIKRLFNRRPVHAADRNHLHHRLLDLGLTQKQAVAVLYGVSGLCGACALVLTDIPPAKGLLFMAGLIVALIYLGRKSGLITMTMHESRTGAANNN